MAFTMQEVHARDATRLAVSGELDLATAEEFAERVRQLSAAGATVLLDLSAVAFMDSSGLNALVNTIREARGADRPIELESELAPQVKRLLELTRVDEFLFAA